MSKLYNLIIRVCDKFVPERLGPLWNHPAGPKTVFFWAPWGKWSLVLAGIGDLSTRPADKISMAQTSSLMTSAMIWARWCVVIIPKNYNLMMCNLFVVLTQGYQFSKAVRHKYSTK